MSRKRATATAPSNDVLDLTTDGEEPHGRHAKRVKTEVKTEVKAEADEPWPRSQGMRQLGGIIDLTT
jgi:hypothetical protein